MKLGAVLILMALLTGCQEKPVSYKCMDGELYIFNSDIPAWISTNNKCVSDNEMRGD